MDTVTCKFARMCGNHRIPIYQHHIVGMGVRKPLQRVIRSRNPRYRCMRINQHQHMVRSYTVQQIIQLFIGHRGVCGKTDQHPLAQSTLLGFGLIHQAQSLGHRT